MPYIPKEQRPAIDAAVDSLADVIAAEHEKTGDEAAVAGLMNYAVSRLIAAVILRRFGQMRYKAIALMTGMLHNVSDEFYRRLGGPYEDTAIAKNGDVDLYAELLEKSVK